MKCSHSKVECYNQCPFKYKLRYIEKLKTYDEFDPKDPLRLGTAMHTGIETTTENAVQTYFKSYPIITDSHIDEQIKMEYLIPKVKEILPPNGKFEVKLESKGFIGFIDYLYPLDDGTYGIIDFKYSNAIEKYSISSQLSIYKYYAEKLLHIKVSKLQFLFIPKIGIRQKKTEELYQFRNRIYEELHKSQITILDVKYDSEAVKTYLINALFIGRTKLFPKQPNDFCDMFCEYNSYCVTKEEYNMLPSTNRVQPSVETLIKLWIYGAPFSGKTTFADESLTPLNLNTDGNVKYVTMARLPIKDEVTIDGRITKRKLAWETFKDAITELERGSDFKTIVVDLLEDTYEYCRLYMYDKLGISHESDDPFRAWDKVRIEFLSTYRRLTNLPYNIILISHEDTSKDLTKKGGDKITAVNPNLNEKASKKIAGMVDLVARVVVDGDKHTLEFKNDEVVFGGGRLTTKVTSCDLNWDSFHKVYEDAMKNFKPVVKPVVEPQEEKESEAEIVEDVKEVIEEPTPEVVEAPASESVEAPVRRQRRVRA